jgi:hypothetical protein
MLALICKYNGKHLLKSQEHFAQMQEFNASTLQRPDDFGSFWTGVRCGFVLRGKMLLGD